MIRDEFPRRYKNHGHVLLIERLRCGDNRPSTGHDPQATVANGGCRVRAASQLRSLAVDRYAAVRRAITLCACRCEEWMVPRSNMVALATHSSHSAVVTTIANRDCWTTLNTR
jgi:CBS domain containing-hemolysin-like protein